MRKTNDQISSTNKWQGDKREESYGLKNQCLGAYQQNAM